MIKNTIFNKPYSLLTWFVSRFLQRVGGAATSPASAARHPRQQLRSAVALLVNPELACKSVILAG